MHCRYIHKRPPIFNLCSYSSVIIYISLWFSCKEADNWTTLSADVDEVFASQDIHKVMKLTRR